MRRVRGPVFPLFRHPLPPLSRTGRVVLAVLFAIWAFAISVAWSPAFADDAQAPKAESPYFAITGDPSVDALPLKSTKVDVRVAGVIADVTVTQHYRNEGQRPIDRHAHRDATSRARFAATARSRARGVAPPCVSRSHRTSADGGGNEGVCG